jgi:hypothetical protein
MAIHMAYLFLVTLPQRKRMPFFRGSKNPVRHGRAIKFPAKSLRGMEWKRKQKQIKSVGDLANLRIGKMIKLRMAAIV